MSEICPRKPTRYFFTILCLKFIVDSNSIISTDDSFIVLELQEHLMNQT